METEVLTYMRGRLSVEQIQQEIADFWAEAETSSRVQAELSAAGIDSHDMLSSANLKDAIEVHVTSSGVDPMTVALVVAFAPTANRMMKDVWRAVLLPRIRRRWGDDAIGGKGNDHG